MRRVLQSVWMASCAVLSLVAVSGGANGEDATSFQEPAAWSVGDVNSTYQEWDVLTSGTGNLPDVGRFPNSSTSTLSVATPGFLTGAHNLYSYSGNYAWRADVDNSDGIGAGTSVIVQTASTLNSGTGVLLDSLAIVQSNGSPIVGGDTASAVRSLTLFEGQIWSAAIGQYVTTQERLWEFLLPNYTGDFRVTGANMVHSSLMQLRVDSMLTPVPEPSAVVLVGIALVAVGMFRIIRRRQRAG